jgi:methyl-accepting chemotaxis protein
MKLLFWRTRAGADSRGLRRLRIAPRMLACFGFAAVLLLALGGFLLLQMQAVRDQAESMERDWLPSVALADSLALALGKLRTESLRLVAGAADPMTVTNAKINVQQLANELDQGFRDYAALVTDDAERDSIKALEQAYRAFLPGLHDEIGLIEQHKEADARLLVDGALSAQGDLMDMQTQLLRELNKQGAAQASEAARQAFGQTRSVAVVALGGALVLMLLLAWRMSASIVGPLRQALQIASVIARGDLSQRIEANGKDEAAQLLRALQAMQDELRGMLERITGAAAQLNTAAEEMSAIMHSSASNLQRQNDEIEMAATAVNQMSQAVEEVAGNAGSTSDESRVSREAASHGQARLDGTIAAIQDLSRNVIGSSEQAAGLAERSREISKVLDVIRGIAEQTNLLALNAAIEAARAGEMGRGFAVVADEVRALAHRTAASTQEIEQMIDSIQQSSQRTVAALRTTASQADQTLEQAAATQAALAAIGEATARIDQRNQLIASAAEQQAQVAREVDRNLVSIRDLSLQTSSGADKTRGASEELTRLAADLHTLVRHFAL